MAKAGAGQAKRTKSKVAAKKKKERYRALTLIWHRGDKRYYRPGDEFGLDHLSEASKWLLVETQIVELIGQPDQDEE